MSGEVASRLVSLVLSLPPCPAAHFRQLQPKAHLVVCYCLCATAPARAETVWVCTQ